MGGNCESMGNTPTTKQSESNRVEEIVGSLIGEAKILGQRLAKINSKFTGLSNLECIKDERCEENPVGYFPKLIKALRYLGDNLEAIRQQVNELDKI